MTFARALALFATGFAGGLALRTSRRQGRRLSPRTRVLLTGAAALQRKRPLQGYHIYLVGIHPMKEDPERQWVAHHYCRQVDEDLAECVLFDGNGRDADLVGVEYIISERLFDALPAHERPLWHPHNGEILSGQLQAPGLPERAERALMREKMNSYGKTWHLWDERDRLPFGPPRLAWSFGRDGEARDDVLARLERITGTAAAHRRAQRAGLARLAHPQQGVDAIAGLYRRPTAMIPGVWDAGR